MYLHINILVCFIIWYIFILFCHFLQVATGEYFKLFKYSKLLNKIKNILNYLNKITLIWHLVKEIKVPVCQPKAWG